MCEIQMVIGSWGSYNECNERALGSKWLNLSDYEDWNEVEPLPSTSIIPDNIAELEQKAIDKLELLTEDDINKNTNLSFFCSNQYFAIKSKRNKKT